MVTNPGRALLVAGFLLLVAALYGQSPEFSVSRGKEFEARKSSLQDIIGYDESGFYALKDRGTFSGPAFSIDHLDYALNFDKSTDLEIQEEGKNCQVQTVLQIKDGLYVFYSFLNNKEKKKILFVDELDKVTLKLKQQKIKLGEIDFSGNSKRHSGSFFVKLSRDGSKVLVFYSMPDSKGDPESFGVNVLDVELHSLWEKTFTMPYAGGLFDIESVRVDNEGNLYLLGLVYKEKRASKRKGLPNYSYEVFSYSDKGNSTKQYPVSLDDRFITDMQIQILNNNLVCGGFYSEKGTFSIRGTYFLTIDLTSREIKTKSFNEFGIDFISQNMSQRDEKIARKEEEKGKDPELFEYSLDQLLIGSDGSAVLVGEQYYVRVVTTTTTINGQKSVRHHYHYYYNDIIAVKINPAGQIEWAQKVAKSQHTIDDGGYYSSYTLAASKGKTWFIFNDNPKNMDYDGEGRPENFNHGKSEAVIVGLDTGGKQTKQAIFSPGDVEVMIRPKVCEQISDQDVILFGQRGKLQQFDKLTFN